MGLSRLENFLKSVRGTILYVDPNSLDATDSIENQGNSLTRPFKTIQRALIEAARFSYQKGLDNDRFGNTTILLYPGDHLVDNRPGWIPDGSNNFRLRSGQTSSNFPEFDLTTNFDLSSSDNALYKFNSIHGGVIIPRGTSIVGLDLRKTKVRPKYVPNPVNNNIERSAVFRVTGGCYFWQFSIFDADPNGQCYADYTNNLFSPYFSHHKLTCFEYADGVNPVAIDDEFQTYSTTRTDLGMYYEKIGLAYGSASGRQILNDYPSASIDIEPKIDEYRIVGSTGLSVGITSIRAGNGITPNTTITVTTSSTVSGLEVDTPFRVEGISVPGYNGQYVVTEKVSDTQIRYKVQSPPAIALPSPSGSVLSLSSDTVTSASPYIFNLTLRSVYGMCGVFADGDKASGFKSMVIAQFTGIGLQKDDNAFVVYNEDSGTYEDNTVVGNETISTNSRALYKPAYRNFHIKCINDAFIQNVSIFAIGYAEHFSVDSGGDQSITNSNSNFGAKALVASGYRRNAFPQDDVGYITHVIPPIEISNEEVSIEFVSLDVNNTISVGSSERLYLYNETNADLPPENVLEGYRIGARENDTLRILISEGGQTTEYGSLIVMQNSQSSSEKTSSVKRSSTGINNIGQYSDGGFANVITLVQPHTFQNGESVRVISDNGYLPDGLTPNTVYYVITNENALSGLTTTTNIKLAKTLNDAKSGESGKELTINSNGGSLKVVSRVSDKIPGEIGHPIQYDTNIGQWYIKVSSSSSTNEIYNKIVSLGTSFLGNATTRTYINRRKYNRNASDSIYRLRYVIPSQSGATYARPPSDGFIIQESNNTTGLTDAEIQTYYGNSQTLSNINQQRNFRFISNAKWNSITNTADITTELPHALTIGAQVELVNIKSSLNTLGVGNSGFNGTFSVSGISSSKQFSIPLSTNPGTFTNDISLRTTALPYFKKKKYNSTYYIHRSQEVQRYISGKQDGIYYLTLVNASNSPIVQPFTSEKYSQPVKDLYPQINRDNPVSDPDEAKSFASSSVIGEVVVNDVRNSITKETISKLNLDSDVGIGITNIVSVSTTSHVVYTSVDHGLNRITKVSIASSGSGYGSGFDQTFYNARLVGFAGSTTGYNATARVSVNALGNITDVVIMDGGSAYGIGNTLSVVGIATTTGFVAGVVQVSNIYNNVGDVVRISGVSSESYNKYNNLYHITSIPVGSEKSFTAYSSEVISGFTTIGVGRTLTANSFTYLTGQSIVVSSINYDKNTGLATVTSVNNHGLSVGNKIRITGDNIRIPSNQEYFYNKDVVVTKNVGLTTFVVNIGVGTTAPSISGSIFAYRGGFTSNDGTISLDYENISGRMVPIYAGITTTLSVAITSDVTDQIRISGIDKLDIKIGDYLQVEDELMRVQKTVPNNVSPSATIYVFRGALGTKSSKHPINSVVRRVSVSPIELRRHSIIRASGHTFEYVGFGPGNYSTAFPDKQNRQISAQEELLAQSTRQDGGINFYTGMNDKGISYSGNKKLSTITGQEEIFDTPVQTVTGEDIGNQTSINIITPVEGSFSRSIRVEGGADGKATSEFNGPVVFNSKVTSTSPKGLEVNSLFIQGDVKVSRKYTVGNSIPTIAGNPGDVQYNATPSSSGYLGWVYTSNNEWVQFGRIGAVNLQNVIGISRNSTYVGLSTLVNFSGAGVVSSQYDSVAGITTIVFASPGIQTGVIGVSTGGNYIGLATQINFVGTNVAISGQYNASSGISTINIVGLGTTSIFRGDRFIKVGAAATNFLKADGSDALISYQEVINALGFTPANTSSVTSNYPQGNSLVVDSIDLLANGGPFDGTKTDFQLKVNGNNFVPFGSAANLLVSIGGVIQKAGSDYDIVRTGVGNTINTNVIRFTTAPQAGKSHFIVGLGGQGILLGDPAWNAKGDLVVGLSDNNATTFSVGADNTVLYADSTVGTGVSWKAIPKHYDVKTPATTNRLLTNREFCSVTTDGVILTLPAIGTEPEYYVTINNTSTFTNIRVDGNGKSIMGQPSTEEFVINIPYATVTLVYVNSTLGWRIA